MLRTFLTTILFLLMSVLGLTLVFLQPLVHALLPRLMSDAGLEISYSTFNIQPLKGRIEVEQFVLRKQGEEHSLLSITSAEATVTLLGLLRMDLESAILTGSNINIYLGNNTETEGQPDTGSGFSPAIFLEYASLIPGRTSIDALVLHWQPTDPTLLTTIEHLSLLPGENAKQHKISGSIKHIDTTLVVAGQVMEHGENEDGNRHSSVHLTLSSVQHQTHLKLDGDILVSPDNINYGLQTDVMMEDIGEIFRIIDVNFDLRGIAHVQGKLVGDLAGLEIAANTVSLDYLPAYQLKGEGKFIYRFGEIPQLDTTAVAQINDQQQLSRWTGVDLSALGKLSAEATVEGPVNDLVLRDAVFSAHSNTELAIEARATIPISRIVSGRLGEERGIKLRVSAPNLSALREWIDPPPLETGPWQVSAHLLQVDDNLALRDILLEAGDRRNLRLELSGNIDDVSSALSGDLENIQGVNLQGSAYSADSNSLVKPFLDTDIPELGAVNIQAAASGSINKLQIHDIAVSSGKALEATIAIQDGSMALSLLPNFSYSDLNLPVAIDVNSSKTLSALAESNLGDLGSVHATGNLRSSGETFSIDKLNIKLREGGKTVLKSHGALASLTPFDGLQLQGDVNGLNTVELLKTLAGDLEQDLDLGHLHGSYTLAFKRGKLELQNLLLENRGSDQFSFSLAGRAISNLNSVSIDMELASKISDTSLLHEITGLYMSPTDSVFKLRGTDQLVHLRGTTRVGSTLIESRLEIAVDENGITDIKGSVTTPSLLTSDFGLDKILSGEQTASTERTATESDNRAGKPIPLDALPNFSFDTILVAGKVVGPSINATNLVAHIAHDGAHSQFKNFAVSLPAGLIRATASLDQSGHEPLWQLDGEIKEFRIENMMAALGSDLEISGGVNSLFSLSSAGNSRTELLDDVDGEAAIALEQVRLKGAAYDQMATDTLAWFFTGGVLKDETRFDCVLGEFKLSDGIVQSETLFAESDHLIADGKVRMDLDTNEIDLAITPRSKKRAFQIPGTIRITGSLDNPKISTSAIATSVDTAAQVVMIAPSIALRAFDTTLSLLGAAPKESEETLSPCQQAQQH